MTATSIQREHILRDYYAFLARKKRSAEMAGLQSVPALNPSMFGYQSDVTDYLLRAGRGAAFLDTGMGKSFISLEWGRVIMEHTNKPVLMLAPLAVGPQHEREAARFGIQAKYIRSPDEITGTGIWISNYERLHLFEPSMFGGLILDESSIVKNFTGKTSRALIAFGESVPYRLAATATPAPNDHMELGQHSAFLGAMASNEMLARWFTADQSEMGKYRLKKYGVSDFWSWVASWARMASRPSDLGHSDDGFLLPKLNQDLHYVEVDLTEGRRDGELFRSVDTSATQIHQEKRRTAGARSDRVAELVAAESGEAWVIWCDTDYEADALTARIPDAVEVRGSMSLEMKEERLNAFSAGEVRHLITKPSVAGFGLNWQHCARSAFVGLSFSYEAYYQAIRRLWRFGQQRPVDVHITLAETEGVIWHTIQRKARDHELMKREMNAAMRRAIQESEVKISYRPTVAARLPEWLQ
jgi:superfamily II DNA or RNA helicase